MKTKQTILLIVLYKTGLRLCLFSNSEISFKVNVLAKQTIATSAHIDENFKTNWEPLLIFSWEADHTVEEKHSHNNHLHINKIF